jgi:hypothetical protein
MEVSGLNHHQSKSRRRCTSTLKIIKKILLPKLRNRFQRDKQEVRQIQSSHDKARKTEISPFVRTQKLFLHQKEPRYYSTSALMILRSDKIEPSILQAAVTNNPPKISKLTSISKSLK